MANLLGDSNERTTDQIDIQTLEPNSHDTAPHQFKESLDDLPNQPDFIGILTDVEIPSQTLGIAPTWPLPSEFLPIAVNPAKLLQESDNTVQSTDKSTNDSMLESLQVEQSELPRNTKRRRKVSGRKGAKRQHV